MGPTNTKVLLFFVLLQGASSQLTGLNGNHTCGIQTATDMGAALRNQAEPKQSRDYDCCCCSLPGIGVLRCFPGFSPLPPAPARNWSAHSHGYFVVKQLQRGLSMVAKTTTMGYLRLRDHPDAIGRLKKISGKQGHGQTSVAEYLVT